MMNKQAWRAMSAIMAAAALLLLMACSKKPTEESAAGGGTTTAAVDKSQAGSVSGSVKFSGAKPAPKKIDMNQDPVCAKKGENTSSQYEGNGDALANVYVYVDNPPAGGDTPTAKVTIDQEGCRYHPHVLAMMINQPLEIKNSDPTTHNIHPTPDPDSGNREWNESQGPGAAPLEKTFSRPEVMLPVKCNQHPWMKMYINVAKSPYFAVTDASGHYEIKDLPPGTYTLVAVHEVGGKKTQSVTIAPKQAATQDFTFGGAGGAGGSK